MHIEIYNCPFCGAEANIHYQGYRKGYLVFCKCSLCEAQSKALHSDENPEDVDWLNQPCFDAIVRWNRRR
nr:MAG TPA: restriction alleviation protein [Caudoviricetes sp.]